MSDGVKERALSAPSAHRRPGDPLSGCVPTERGQRVLRGSVRLASPNNAASRHRTPESFVQKLSYILLSSYSGDCPDQGDLRRSGDRSRDGGAGFPARRSLARGHLGRKMSGRATRLGATTYPGEIEHVEYAMWRRSFATCRPSSVPGGPVRPLPSVALSEDGWHGDRWQKNNALWQNREIASSPGYPRLVAAGLCPCSSRFR